jgi:hypothetical protein
MPSGLSGNYVRRLEEHNVGGFYARVDIAGENGKVGVCGYSQKVNERC